MSSSLPPADESLELLLPHLNAPLQKYVESLQKIARLFPGQSPAEIEKNIRLLKEAATSSVAAFVERLQKLVHSEGDGAHADSIEKFLKDAGKLKAVDLQAVAAGIAIPVPKQKPAILQELRRWIESKGLYAPRSPLDKKMDLARELVGDLPQQMIRLTPPIADEILRRAEAAAKDKNLGSEGFVAFASLLLGMPVKGTKSAILKQIKSTVERLVVSHAQTSAIG